MTYRPNLSVITNVPIATTTTLGGIKPDGTSLAVDSQGVASVVGLTASQLEHATATVPADLVLMGRPGDGSFYLVGQAVAAAAYAQVLAAPPLLVVPDKSFDGSSRLARDMLDGVGVCADLGGATPAQIAAALEMLRFPLVRSRGVTSAGSSLRAMLAVRSTQAGLGSIRPARFLALATGYMNDQIAWSAQMPGLLAMVNAGVLWGIEAPNEINNNYTGGGTRGPNDTTNKSANGQYQPNFIDWATQLRAFKAANLAAFAKAGLVTLSSSLAPILGDASNYAGGMNMEALSDYWNVHHYAGAGRQPSFPYGASPTLGYFGNVVRWAAGGFSPTGLRQGVVTECGATTMGPGGYARTGKSQAIYMANQLLQSFALNMKAVFFYCLFDPSGAVGDVEGNYGLFKTDRVTPKPAVAVLARMQDILSLGNDANNPANIEDRSTKRQFKPGLNAAQLAITGVNNQPNGVKPFLTAHKSDGSSVVWLWNEPTVDDGNGNDVTPADDPVTVYLPRLRTWRLHDPFATTALSADPWNTGDTVALTLKGYPMAIEVAPPPGWTAAGGEPADLPSPGFDTLRMGQIYLDIAHTNPPTPPDHFVKLGPPSGQLFTPGNVALIVACHQTDVTPTCPGGTVLGRYSLSNSPVATMTVWRAPIENPHMTWTIADLNESCCAVVIEVGPFSSYSASMASCTWTGSKGQPGCTVSGSLAAVPSGSQGFFFVGVPRTSGDEHYNNASDSSVIIKALLINSQFAHYSQMFCGTIAGERAAGSATWPVTNMDYDLDSPNIPVVLTVVTGP